MSNFVLVEGFDYYNGGGSTNGGYRSVWTASGGGDWLTAVGRFGVGQRCRLGDATGNTASIRREIPGGPVGPDYALGFAFAQGDSATSGQQFAVLYSDSVEQLNLRPDAPGNRIHLYLGNTLLGSTPDNTITLGESHWVWIDLVVTADPVEGHAELWVNGARYIDYTGPTATAGKTTIDRLMLQCPDGSGSSNWASFDDLLLSDSAERIGEKRIDYLAVSADTATKDWTPSTGADNYAMLDETPVSVSDYTIGNLAGDHDVFELEDAALDGAAIAAVQPLFLASKTDAGDRHVDVQALSGSSVDSAVAVLSTTPTIHYGPIMESDPDTAAAWTPAGFDALQLGLEITL